MQDKIVLFYQELENNTFQMNIEEFPVYVNLKTYTYDGKRISKEMKLIKNPKCVDEEVTSKSQGKWHDEVRGFIKNRKKNGRLKKWIEQ